MNVFDFTARDLSGTERSLAEWRGHVLLIDYGAPAAELYDPVRRPAGTLLAYLGHEVRHDVLEILERIGQRDLLHAPSTIHEAPPLPGPVDVQIGHRRIAQQLGEQRTLMAALA